MSNDLYPSLYSDPEASGLVEQLDYDFTIFDRKIRSFMGKFGVLETAMRQNDLAWEVREYLSKNPRASVVNLGCGLDRTAERMDNGICRIYNLDFETVIEVRNQLIPPTDRVINLPVDLNDFRWFQQIEKDNGVIFIGSGLFYYFTKEAVRKIFQAMEEYFHAM